MTQIFRHRKILIITVFTVIIAFMIAFAAIWLLYQNARQDMYNRLNDIAVNEKVSIEIWTNVYQKNEEEIIAHLRLEKKNGAVIGRSGEIVIARPANDSLEFIISRKMEIYRIPVNYSLATPMQRAINHESGYLIGRDYEGYKVYAAYTFVEKINWGIVAKIPVAEVNRPYFVSISIVFFLTLLLVTFLSYLLIKTTNPILDKLLNNERLLIAARENAEASEKVVRMQKDEIEFNNARLESLLKISQYSTSSIQDLLDYALNEAIKLTGSKIGYIYFYEEKTKQFILNTWSKEVMNECRVQNPETVYDLDKTGCWGEAVRQRKPIIINDYEAENHLKKGLPEGHVTLKTFMTVPIFVGTSIVAVAGLANKQNGYDNADTVQLTLLMDSVWKIAHRIYMEIDLRNANDKLKELNATKDKFFSIISHDLKSPFTSLLGITEVLLENHRTLKPDEIEEYFSHLNEASKSTLELLDNLLTWAQSQTGRLELSQSKVNLKVLTTDITRLLQTFARDKKIMLINTIDKDIWVWADPNMLTTVLRNLIQNAVKYTRSKGSVTIGVTVIKEFAEIWVADTGIGMTDKGLNSLFRIGENVSMPGTNNERGTGLGLILCRDFVEKHGGTIRAESETGMGSRFYFTMPLYTRQAT